MWLHKAQALPKRFTSYYRALIPLLRLYCTALVGLFTVSCMALHELLDIPLNRLDDRVFGYPRRAKPPAEPLAPAGSAAASLTSLGLGLRRRGDDHFQ